MLGMERAEGPQTPFEVYCYDCRSTFALGTRSCVHCGRPIAGRAARPQLDARPHPLETQDDEGPEQSLARRIGGTSLWVLVALAAAASRLCAEG
jgi:hypothetical protein